MSSGNNSKTGIILIAICCLLLVGGSIGSYFLFFKDDEASNISSSSMNNEPDYYFDNRNHKFYEYEGKYYGLTNKIPKNTTGDNTGFMMSVDEYEIYKGNKFDINDDGNVIDSVNYSGIGGQRGLNKCKNKCVMDSSCAVVIDNPKNKKCYTVKGDLDHQTKQIQTVYKSGHTLYDWWNFQNDYDSHILVKNARADKQRNLLTWGRDEHTTTKPTVLGQDDNNFNRCGGDSDCPLLDYEGIKVHCLQEPHSGYILTKNGEDGPWGATQNGKTEQEIKDRSNNFVNSSGEPTGTCMNVGDWKWKCNGNDRSIKIDSSAEGHKLNLACWRLQDTSDD